EAGRGGADLQPDEARPNDDHSAPWADPFAKRGRVGDRAQREDAWEVDARHVEAPLPRAGRQDEAAVFDRGPIAGLDPARSAVDPDRADPAPQVDAMVAEKGLGSKRQPVDVHLALEKGLRQRRPLIGKLLLVG